MKRIVFLLDKYSISSAAGASSAVRTLYDSLSEKYDITIVCASIDGSDNDNSRKIIVATPTIACKYIIDNNINIIHYFKSTGRRYFKSIIRVLHSLSTRVHIVTTVCQKPSFLGLELSPFEIKASNSIVFIDKAAYNDKKYSFISEKHKRLIYFGVSKKRVDLIDRIRKNFIKDNNDYIHFGRGSSLNKCHKEMIKTFDAIGANNKKFTFVGGHELPEILKKEIYDRKDVVWYSAMNYEKWLERCNEFDVFLYQLPEDTYSSIDGTLGDAMLLGIPPIVYGPDAIKERIHHGENGYVAETMDDIIRYANILASSEEIRKQMGENARKTTLDEFPLSQTINQYVELYENFNTYQNNKVIIPINFLIFYSFRIVRIIPKFLKSKCNVKA